MDWKQGLYTALMVMFFIFAFKWIHAQYPIPVLGKVIETI